MALNRYNHKFPAPLQINEQVVNTSTVSSLNATNITNNVSLSEGLSITKEFTNNAEDFIIRPASFAAWRGGISWTRSTGTSARGLRVASWDNNGSRSDWFSVWNGSVGIGSGLDITTGQFVGPRGKLHVGEDLTNGGTDAAAYNFKQSSAGSTDGFYIERSGERKGYYIFVDASNADSLTFRRNNDGTKANSLEISRTGDVTVREGNLVIGTSGKGIDFSATANSGNSVMTSELFADYEEGTWTPSIGGTATYTQQSGSYTKIGRMVTVTFYLTISSKGTGSNSTITGLPFGAVSRTGGGGIAYWQNLATAVTYTAAYIYGGTQIDFYSGTAATNTLLSATTIFGNGSTVQGCITYESV